MTMNEYTEQMYEDKEFVKEFIEFIESADVKEHLKQIYNQIGGSNKGKTRKQIENEFLFKGVVAYWKSYWDAAQNEDEKRELFRLDEVKP